MFALFPSLILFVILIKKVLHPSETPDCFRWACNFPSSGPILSFEGGKGCTAPISTFPEIFPPVLEDYPTISENYYCLLVKKCKEIEENNRMRKTRDLFKKIRDTKGTFHAKMGSIKDRNGTDLTEAEDIKKMWQEYTEELYKKDLHDPDNHYGVIIHLEPDILECEVKWP